MKIEKWNSQIIIKSVEEWWSGGVAEREREREHISKFISGLVFRKRSDGECDRIYNACICHSICKHRNGKYFATARAIPFAQYESLEMG